MFYLTSLYNYSTDYSDSRSSIGRGLRPLLQLFSEIEVNRGKIFARIFFPSVIIICTAHDPYLGNNFSVLFVISCSGVNACNS